MSIAEATAPILRKLEAMDAANQARFDSLETMSTTRFNRIERRFDTLHWTCSALIVACFIGVAILNDMTGHH